MTILPCFTPIFYHSDQSQPSPPSSTNSRFWTLTSVDLDEYSVQSCTPTMSTNSCSQYHLIISASTYRNMVQPTLSVADLITEAISSFHLSFNQSFIICFTLGHPLPLYPTLQQSISHLYISPMVFVVQTSVCNQLKHNPITFLSLHIRLPPLFANPKSEIKDTEFLSEGTTYKLRPRPCPYVVHSH